MGLADNIRMLHGLPPRNDGPAERSDDGDAFFIPAGSADQTPSSLREQVSFVRVLGNLLSNLGRKGMGSSPEPARFEERATQAPSVPETIQPAGRPSRGWLGFGSGRENARLQATVSAAVHDAPTLAWNDDTSVDDFGEGIGQSASPPTAPNPHRSAAEEAEYRADYEKGYAEGRAKVHARILQIRNDPRCQGREAAALQLAVSSPDMSPEAVCVFVEKYGPEASGPGEAGLVFGRLPPLPGHGAQSHGAYVNPDRFWGESVERVNRELHP